MLNKVKDFVLKYAIWILLVVDVILVVQNLFYVFRTDIIQCDYGQWVSYMKQNGFLSIYHVGSNGLVESSCNYPPIYVYFLWLVMRFDQGIDSNVTNLLLKICPYIFFFISQVFIYKKISKEAALAWTFNIAFIINFAVWGQRDIAFGFLLIGMFYSFYKKQKYMPSIWFALICLLKPQGCLFLPCYLIYMIMYVDTWKTKILSAASGIMPAVVMYLPFMVHEGTPRVFFDVYLASSDNYFLSFGTYAPNVYIIYSGRTVPVSWFWMINVILTIYMMFMFILIFKKTRDLIFSSMLYSYLTFMLCLGQHERYALYYVFFIFFFYYMFGHLYSESFRKNMLRVYTLGSVAAFIGQFVYVAVMEPVEWLRVKYGFPFDELTSDLAKAFFVYCQDHPVTKNIYDYRLLYIFLGTLLNIWCGYIIYKKLYPEVKKNPIDLVKI